VDANFTVKVIITSNHKSNSKHIIILIMIKA